MEQILAFVTPCQPLTDRCKFSLRVFTSWISSGLVLGLILGLFSLGSKTPNPAGLFFNLLFTIPTAICTVGLIGLAISSSRGDSNYQAGWYWYFFPIVTYLVIGFWIGFATVAFVLSISGVKLPKPQFNSNSNNGRRRKTRPQKKDVLEIVKQNKNLLEKKKEEIVKQKKELLNKYSNEKELEEHPEERYIAQSLSLRETILGKVREMFVSYPSIEIEELLYRVDEFLTEEEIEELFLMLDEWGLIDSLE